jgi:hypothetical protein
MHLHHAQANRHHNSNKQASPNTDKMRSFFLFALLVAAASAFVAPANKAVGKSLFSVLARLLRSRARGRPTGQLLPGRIVRYWDLPLPRDTVMVHPQLAPVWRFFFMMY